MAQDCRQRTLDLNIRFWRLPIRVRLDKIMDQAIQVHTAEAPIPTMGKGECGGQESGSPEDTLFLAAPWLDLKGPRFNVGLGFRGLPPSPFSLFFILHGWDIGPSPSSRYPADLAGGAHLISFRIPRCS